MTMRVQTAQEDGCIIADLQRVEVQEDHMTQKVQKAQMSPASLKMHALRHLCT